MLQLQQLNLFIPDISDIFPDLTTSSQLTTLPTTNSATETSQYTFIDFNTGTNKSFRRTSGGFFTYPANLAAVSTTGGIVTTGVLTAAACKLAKKKTEIIPNA